MLNRRSSYEIDGYSDFVFLTREGKPMTPVGVYNCTQNIINAYNKKEITKAINEKREPILLPRVTSHCFRHTACTNMIRNGMNVKIVQYIMGHKSSSMTMEVYNHMNNEMDIKKEIYRCENLKIV